MSKCKHRYMVRGAQEETSGLGAEMLQEAPLPAVLSCF